MTYSTCVSVAEQTPARMIRTLRRALAGSDFAELRLDFLPPHEIPAALELAKRHLRRTVCTVRAGSEGGVFTGTERERRRIIRLAAEYGPMLLDIEYDTIRKDAALLRYVRRTGTDVLVSWHDLGGTPSPGRLRRRLSLMRRFSRHVKIVTRARRAADASYVLSLYADAKKTDLVAFAMGTHGRISRILCLYLGSPFTYVSLGRPVAPGQFSLAEIKKITGARQASA